MSDDPALLAIGWLSESNQFFADQMGQLGVATAPTPTGQLLARLGAFGFLQSQAIAALADSPNLHLQVSSLVRGVLETWAVAAWLSESDDSNERYGRALGYESASLQQTRTKLEYQAANTDGKHDEPFHALAEREARLNKLVAAADHVTQRPDLRSLMERLGRSDRYVAYRWDSDSVHISSVALGQLVTNVAGVQQIGAPASPIERVARLVMAWDAVSDLYEIIMREFNLDLAEWNRLRQTIYERLTSLMKSLEDS